MPQGGAFFSYAPCSLACGRAAKPRLLLFLALHLAAQNPFLLVPLSIAHLRVKIVKF